MSIWGKPMLKIGIREVVKLLKNSGMGFLISQVDGTIEYCDKETRKWLIGFKRGQKLDNTLLRQYIEVVYPHSEDIIPESLNCWMQIWKTVGHGGTKWEQEQTWELGALGVRIKQGENVLDKVLFLIFPISREESLSTGFQEPGVSYLLKVIKELPLLVLQIDSLGNIVYVNDRIKDLTGWLPLEVRGKNWFEMFVPEEIREEMIQFLQVGKQEIGTAISFEGEILTRDKQRLLILWACLGLEGEGQGSNLLLMLGQELNTSRWTKFLTRGIRLLKNQLQWIYEELVRGIPEEEVFSEVVRNVVEMTSLEAGVVFKVVSKKVVLISSEGLEDKITESLKEISLDNKVVDTIMSSNDVIEISSLMDSFPINLQEKGFVEVFAVPIRIGEEPVGFFALATTRDDMLEEEIIPLLYSIACEIGWMFLWYNIQEIQRRRGLQYELLEQMLPYALLSVDEGGVIVSCNRGGINLLEADSEEDLLNCEIQQFIPDWKQCINKLGQEKELRNGSVHEIEIMTLKGQKIPVEFIVGHFSFASRSFYMVFLRDIQWRKQAIDTIKQAEELYKDLFENANDIIYTHDLEGRFTSLNKAALNATGYSLEEALNLNIFDVIAPEYIEEVKKKICEKLNGAHSTKYEIEIVSKEGKRIPLEVNTSVIYEKGLPVAIQGIGRNVTDRKKAEEERKRLEAQILYSQKLESLGILAAGIAHEYNNILVGIMGNAELALARLPEDSPIRNYLKKIEESSQRAAELTNQMLAYSGQKVITQRLINLSKLIEEMIPLFSAVISKKATIEFDCAAELPSIYGDATQIYQLLMDLIANASEAIGDTSGKITIQTNTVNLSEEQIKSEYFLESVAPGRYVYVEISDTGVGMSEEMLSKIFDPFFSTKFAGRGLGLAAVLGIIHGHKGTISVYSKPGKGSTFKVYFPVSETSDTPLYLEKNH